MFMYIYILKLYVALFAIILCLWLFKLKISVIICYVVHKIASENYAHILKPRKNLLVYLL